ncbi:MAG: hypothetical protein LAT55_12985, partial [Opitutales bacterium]|nr:hypothetical protein [Opitutales bacterium]
ADFDTIRPEPKRGETWRHCKGSLYRIDAIVFGADELFEDYKDQRCVVYKKIMNGDVSDLTFVRSMHDFMRLHSSGAVRFVRVLDKFAREVA